MFFFLIFGMEMVFKKKKEIDINDFNWASHGQTYLTCLTCLNFPKFIGKSFRVPGVLSVVDINLE